MEFLVIPSFPSYKINNLGDIRNIKTGKYVKKKSGIVVLYQKHRLTTTRRAVKKLLDEALSHHNQSHNPTSLAIHEETPQGLQASSDELASDLLASILTRYKNIPIERLSHKECIDLLKTLMGKAKKVPVVKEKDGDGYITPEEYKSIYERHKNRDYSGNNLKDVEEIYREYAPKRTNDTKRQPIRLIK